MSRPPTQPVPPLLPRPVRANSAILANCAIEAGERAGVRGSALPFVAPSLRRSVALFFTICYLLSTICSAAQPTTRPAAPDTVLLKELVEYYEPVPFDHKSHAGMAEMSQGCTLCHHYSPKSPPQSANDPHFSPVPACKTCHPASGVSADIQQPNLKGAYHRQCLNCHKEWMHSNACVVCHKPLDAKATPATAPTPTPGDIVGRMHPPLKEPDVKHYKPRFTPADGGNVLFRHKEHVEKFALKCADCHHRDNCANCHDGRGGIAGPKPMRAGATWSESHAPCISCHRDDRCNHCHYRDDEQPRPSFDHRMTGQILDKDHASLACKQCHPALKTSDSPTCNNAACHSKPMTFPHNRPGPQLPSPLAAAPEPKSPTTRPTIQKIRR